MSAMPMTMPAPSATPVATGGEAGAPTGRDGAASPHTAALFASLASQVAGTSTATTSAKGPAARSAGAKDSAAPTADAGPAPTATQLPAALLAAMMAAATTTIVPTAPPAPPAPPAPSSPTVAAAEGAPAGAAPTSVTAAATTPSPAGPVSDGHALSLPVAATPSASLVAQTGAAAAPAGSRVGRTAGPAGHAGTTEESSEPGDGDADTGSGTAADRTPVGLPPSAGGRHAAAPVITLAPNASVQAATVPAAPTQAALHPAALQAAGTARVDAPTPTSAPTRHAEIADRVEAANPDPNVARLGSLVRTARRGDVHTATLELTPPELGHVQVELRSHEGVVSLHVTAVSGDGAAAIRNAVAPLRRELEAAGIGLGTVDVNVGNGAADQSGRGGADADQAIDPDLSVRGLARPGARPTRVTRSLDHPDQSTTGVDVDL